MNHKCFIKPILLKRGGGGSLMAKQQEIKWKMVGKVEKVSNFPSYLGSSQSINESSPE